MNSNL